MAPAPGTPNNGLYKTLSAPAYSIAETSRLTGIKKWSVSRWLRGYKYYGGELDPVISRSIPPESTFASFLDLIDLLFINKFIESGFSLQHIRKALEEARVHLGTQHFARSKFFTSSNEMILELPEGNMVALLKDGQRAMGEVVKNVHDKVDFEEITEFGFVKRWFPKGRDGFIVIDPQISYGRPTIEGSGIATENVFDLFLGENKTIDPVRHWFDLPDYKIQAAVNFETSLVA